jgi:hypothetical protein
MTFFYFFVQVTMLSAAWTLGRLIALWRLAWLAGQ